MVNVTLKSVRLEGRSDVYRIVVGFMLLTIDNLDG
jgi:hypothetical protein